MNKIPLSPQARRLLAAKAAQNYAREEAELGSNDPIAASFFESLDDHGLRLFADDFTAEEWADMERNSDWVADLEEKQKEADRKAGKPEVGDGLTDEWRAKLQQFATTDHRTANQRAGLAE